MSWLAILVAFVPPLGVSVSPVLNFEEHEPIELRAELEIPEGFDVAMIDWSIRGAGASGREYDDANVFAVWASPGRYEIECEAMLVNWEARQFRKIERVYVLAVQGAQPPPFPVDPVTPDPPKPIEVTGPLYSIVIRKAELLTADQTEALLQIRTWADRQDNVRHLEFPPDAVNGDGSENEVVQSYVAKMPSGAKMPYVFVVQKTKAGDSYIHYQGELLSAEQVIDLLGSLRVAMAVADEMRVALLEDFRK